MMYTQHVYVCCMPKLHVTIVKFVYGELGSIGTLVVYASLTCLACMPLTPAGLAPSDMLPHSPEVRGRGTLVLGCTKVLPVLGGAPRWSPRTYREGQGHMRAQRAQGSHVFVGQVLVARVTLLAL